MRKYLVGSLFGLGLAVAVGTATAGPGDCEEKGPNNHVKDKRKIAVELCVAMAMSGAYTTWDDNQLSTYCINVASHLGDSAYDHTD